MQQITGISVIATQVITIINIFDSALSIYAPVVMNILQAFSTLAAMYVLSKWGRRPLLLIGNFSLALLGIILGILMIFPSWGPAVIICIILLTIFLMVFGWNMKKMVLT